MSRHAPRRGREKRENLSDPKERANELYSGEESRETQVLDKNPNDFERDAVECPEALIFLTFFEKNSKKRLTGEENSVILYKLAREGVRKGNREGRTGESRPNLENDTEDEETRKKRRARDRSEQTAKIPKSLADEARAEFVEGLNTRV